MWMIGSGQVDLALRVGSIAFQSRNGLAIAILSAVFGEKCPFSGCEKWRCEPLLRRAKLRAHGGSCLRLAAFRCSLIGSDFLGVFLIAPPHEDAAQCRCQQGRERVTDLSE
jgi:hypothetical protein